jgi:putative membrane protein
MRRNEVRTEVTAGRVLRGVVAGALGGLAASWVMNRAQAMVPPPGYGDASDTEHEDDATVKVARRLSCAVLHHDIDENEKERAGAMVHYAFGASLGALYGGLAEAMPAVRRGFGATFATAVWLIADELAVPSLHLAKPANEKPMPLHAYALGSHLVYGAALETVRGGVQRLLDGHTNGERMPSRLAATGREF